MQTTTAAKPAAQVSPRIEAERQQRRRRNDLDIGRHRTLALPPELDDPNYVYRWINDEPGRVHRLTQLDDYDVVTLPGASGDKDKQVGTAIERVVDKQTGKRAILVRKPKAFYASDKLKEQGLLDRQDEELKRGTLSQTSPEARELSGAGYVPDGGRAIRIQDGRKS